MRKNIPRITGDKRKVTDKYLRNERFSIVHTNSNQIYHTSGNYIYSGISYKKVIFIPKKIKIIFFKSKDILCMVDIKRGN